MTRTSRASASLIAAALVLTSACDRAAAQPLPLRLVTDIPIDRASRRFDYASVDPRTGLLFVADLAGGRVLVFDIRGNRLLKAIVPVQGAHGVTVVPELGRVYASATGVDEVVAIDEATLQITARSPSGHYPDGIAWAPRQNKVYVSDENGNVVGVIDGATHKLLKAIPMGGRVGNTQYDAVSGLIYSNAQTRNELVGIDPATDAIISRDRMTGCEGNHGLLIDAPRRLAYIACEGNAKLVTFSLARHAIVDVRSVGADPDVLAYDAQKARLYVAGEGGVVSMFDTSADKPVKVGEAIVADNAHVVAVDPTSHRVFFPLRNVGGKPVLRVMEPR
jgi:DNA-binding beta-propeller fold protein YncE